MPVPASKATLRIPAAEFKGLPVGATYTDKNGRASVSMGLKGDTIYVTAACDSLAREVEYYETELSRIRSEWKKEAVTTKTPFKTLFIRFLTVSVFGFLAGFLAGTFLKKKR